MVWVFMKVSCFLCRVIEVIVSESAGWLAMSSDWQLFLEHVGTCRHRHSYALRLLLNHVSRVITTSLLLSISQTRIKNLQHHSNTSH